MSVEIELPRDLVDLAKAYAAGKLGTLEFVSQLEARARRVPEWGRRPRRPGAY